METNISNASSFDLDLFRAVNSAVNITLFFVAVLPGLVLCFLCVLALLLANSINWPLRISLINIFLNEIWHWCGMSVWFLGYPARVGKPPSANKSCLVFFGTVISAVYQKFLAITLYAVMVYFFLKYGVKKLKMKWILPYIVVTWAFSILLGSLPYFPDFGAFNNNGFCNSKSATTSRVFTGVVVSSVVVLVLCMLVTSIFSILVYRYMRLNTLEENAPVKRAVVKNLVYLLIATLLSFITYIMPTSFSRIRMVLADNVVLQAVVVEYILRLSLNFGTIATPIVAIVILKPVRVSLKKIFTKMCICCNRAQGSDQN